MSTAKHVSGELRYERRLTASGMQLHQLTLPGDYVIAEHRTLGKSKHTEANWTELVRRWNTQPQLLEALKALLAEWNSRTAMIESCDLTEAEDRAVELVEAAIEKATQ